TYDGAGVVVDEGTAGAVPFWIAVAAAVAVEIHAAGSGANPSGSAPTDVPGVCAAGLTANVISDAYAERSAGLVITGLFAADTGIVSG
uniref:hypothetical protein n=1 Tax=Brachyspira hyodysenteriae TaxID=159 RepID=UPI0015C48200